MKNSIVLLKFKKGQTCYAYNPETQHAIAFSTPEHFHVYFRDFYPIQLIAWNEPFNTRKLDANPDKWMKVGNVGVAESQIVLSINVKVK